MEQEQEQGQGQGQLEQTCLTRDMGSRCEKSVSSLGAKGKGMKVLGGRGGAGGNMFWVSWA